MTRSRNLKKKNRKKQIKAVLDNLLNTDREIYDEVINSWNELEMTAICMQTPLLDVLNEIIEGLRKTRAENPLVPLRVTLQAKRAEIEMITDDLIDDDDFEDYDDYEDDFEENEPIKLDDKDAQKILDDLLTAEYQEEFYNEIVDRLDILKRIAIEKSIPLSNVIKDCLNDLYKADQKRFTLTAVKEGDYFYVPRTPLGRYMSHNKYEL